MPKRNLALANPQGIETYFTDLETIRDTFSNLVSSPTIHKRLLFIYGDGGIGKTSLLEMFQIFCKRSGAPVALVPCDMVKVAIDVLSTWGDNLEMDGTKLPTFTKMLKHYRTLENKVQLEQQRHSFPNIAGKIISKTAECATTLALTAYTASISPAVSTLAGSLGGAIVGTGAEEIQNFLRGFLKKNDIDLLINPTKTLTDCFLTDISRLGSRKRLVLMIDAYEKIKDLEDWACSLAKRLDSNVLLVIAGRETVNWDRKWDGVAAHTMRYHLDPMSKEIMRKLIYNYYATHLGGDPDPSQVEKVIRFARGLPMAVTTTVSLWVKYQVKEFEEVEASAVGEIVRKLTQGIPAEMIRTLEAASIMRYFNKESLTAVSGTTNIDTLYEELHQFPFIKPGTIGDLRVFRIHDIIRQMIDRKVFIDSPEYHHTLHRRAANYYETLIKGYINATGYFSHEQLNLLRGHIIENLYHRLFTNETDGFKLVRDTFMGYLRRYDLTICEEIIAMLRSIPNLNSETMLWTEYLDILLTQSHSNLEDGFEKLQTLLRRELPPQLEVQVRWNLGYTMDHRGSRKQALKELSDALALARTNSPVDRTMEVKILTRLGILQGSLVSFETAYQSLREAIDIARNIRDTRLLIEPLNEINYLYQIHNRFEDCKPILLEIISLSEEIGDKRELGLALTRMGEYLIATRDYSDMTDAYISKAIAILELVDDQQSLAWASRCKGLALMGQGSPETALKYLEKSVRGYITRKATRGLFRAYVAQCECLVMLSEYRKVRELYMVIEEWNSRVDLGDWRARWLTVQGDVEIFDHSEVGKDDAIRLGIQKYAESLKLGMTESCSLLYQIADHVAASIRSLKDAGHVEEAKLIVSSLVSAWTTVTERSRSLSDTENNKYSNMANQSVVERMNSILL